MFGHPAPQRARREGRKESLTAGWQKKKGTSINCRERYEANGTRETGVYT